MLNRIRRPELPFILLGLIGGYAAFHATAWSPWAFSDATGYIVAARNLLAGHGIGSFDPAGRFSPGVSHPPLYVLSLGAVGLLGLEPLQAARILDIVLFGILVSAGGIMLFRLTGTLWLGVAFSAFTLVHPALLIAYTSAMAEPPFILAGLASLLLLSSYVLKPQLSTLVGAGICSGLALLSRYPGAAFVLGGAISVLLLLKESWSIRLRRAGSFVAIGVTPILLFLAWATFVPGAESPRALKAQIELLSPLSLFFQKLGAAIWTWKPIPPAILMPDWVAKFKVPSEWLTSLGAGATVVLVVLAALTYRRLRQHPDRLDRAKPAVQMLSVFSHFIIAYLGFFAVAYVITDPTPDVDSRTMLPLLPALIGIGLGGARMLSSAWPRNRLVSAGLTIAILGSIAGYAVISQDIVLGLHRTGLGYTGREWRQSETIAAVREIPADTPLISNEPAAVLLLTGRNPYTIYEIEQQEPVEVFESFGDGPSEAERVFRDEGAALVLFDTAEDQFESLYGNKADERLGIFLGAAETVFLGEDGSILFANSASINP